MNFYILLYTLYSAHLQCRHLISALNAWVDRAKHTITRLIAAHFHGYGCENRPHTSQLNVFLIRIYDIIMCLAYFLDMNVCMTSHRQMPGRLVQDLNVFTECLIVSPHSVPVISSFSYVISFCVYACLCVLTFLFSL